MPIFKKVAEGKAWTRNTQNEFQEELAKSGVRTDGSTRSDSGGKRTWATYPKTFGLWYEDDGKVVLTSAAEKVILGGSEAIKQIRHQILRFQWPNRTQEHRSQMMDESFKIFPYRFLLKLLLDDRIGYLLTSEIALFVLQVKNESEIENTVKNILKYRKKKESDGKSLKDRTDLIKRHMEFRSRKIAESDYSISEHYKYVTDLANTFMNHLEFFEEVLHGSSQTERENQIRIEPNRILDVKKIIALYDRKFPLSILAKHSEAKWFVENYGNRYDRTKASRKTTKPKMKTNKDKEFVKRIGDEALRKNTTMSTKELVLEISRKTGINKNQIEKIVSSNIIEFGWYKTNDLFAKRYLQIASDGKMHEEFEDMTRKIFQSFGFPTEKLTFTTETGNQLVIDGFVQNNPYSGVIDAKSGNKFSCGNKDVGIMKDYIKNFKEHVHKGIKFKLEFFAYVYGRKFENERNFKRIIKESGFSGTKISAPELLRLKESFENGKITRDEIWKLFKKNDEIASSDY